MARRRLFGLKDDATSGGSTYDTLIAGAVPDADTFWPVTGGDVDKGTERIDRNAEVRGRRAGVAPLPFRSRPSMTVPVPAYRTVLEKALAKCLGGAVGVTGTAPAARTHSIASIDYPASALPAVHAQLVRDDLNHKMSGGAVDRVSCSFPLDGEGTAEIAIVGLFMAHFSGSVPTAAFTGLSQDVMMLRDAQMFIDGSVTAVPNLKSFDFSFTNNVEPDWYAKKNIVTQSIGTGPQVKKMWYPTVNKIGAAQDVTYSIGMGGTDATQELAHDFAQIQKFVFEVEGAPLATTPAATELLRVTIYNGVHTGGGADGLTARDDINSSFEGGAFYSTADTDDIKIEFVNNLATI